MMKAAILSGAGWGSVVCLPLGIFSGILICNLLPEETQGATVLYVALVALVWVGWGAFIGAMLKAQAVKEP